MKNNTQSFLLQANFQFFVRFTGGILVEYNTNNNEYSYCIIPKDVHREGISPDKLVK